MVSACPARRAHQRRRSSAITNRHGVMNNTCRLDVTIPPMLGAALLMMWIYRLDPREALSLKPVKPAVWLAILFLIPSGHITAFGIFRVVNIVK